MEHRLAQDVLERGLRRAKDEDNSQRKGFLLELVTAVMMRQVHGWEVKPKGISRRSQQIDVAVHNRNVGGVLGRSPLVLAEVKNWGQPVPAREYIILERKLASSNGLAKMGFFVTTNAYTEGAYIEAVRDTKHDILLVLLDKHSFPAIWRNSNSITGGVEEAILKSVEDQRQRLGD